MSHPQEQRSTRGPRGLRDRCITLAILGACTMVAGRGSRAADTLDQALLRQAPQVIGYLKEHGYKNVGVLKFRIKKGDEATSDHVGPLNLNLAGRLEIALVLANDLKDPIGIIRDADHVAATISGANHLSQPGRQALFTGKYPLAWGTDRVTPDAFLTGVALLSPDRRSIEVGILGFDRKGESLTRVTVFAASADAPVLAEAGESFLIRGAFDSGRTEETREKVVTAAVEVKATPEKSPLRDPAAPVALEIRYDGKPIPLEIREGKAEVREPAENQKVAFVIRKVDKTPTRYGVVLLVNDVNTMLKESLSPLRAGKWLLSPDHRETTINGYQTGEKTAEAFRVLSKAASKTNAVRYGPAAGTITLVVFREKEKGQEKDKSALPLDDEGEDLAALSRGVLPRETPQTLAALKFRLRDGGRVASRGLIVEGEKFAGAFRTETFEPDPTPVMSATITYYKP